MTVVIDFDDTICFHLDKERTIEDAIPIPKTVDKMRNLNEHGCRIVIYTARGQKSCDGDILLIEAKYRARIEKWLAANKVPYDELVFGKPLGDLYIDDKGMSLEAFNNMEFEALKGNSGSKIFRLDRHVIKTCPDAYAQAEWYKRASEIGVEVPKVYSVVLDTIDMTAINGQNASDGVSGEEIYQIAEIVYKFSKIRGPAFDVEALIARALNHLADDAGMFNELFSYMRSHKADYQERSTFCHGDMSLSNIIITDEGNVALIDPIVRPEYSSYLMDLAKLKFSLHGGENFLHPGREVDDREASEALDRYIGQKETRLVDALTAVYWIRLLNYNRDRRQEILSKARRAWE